MALLTRFAIPILSVVLTVATACTCKQKMQVYSYCHQPVYCKYSGPDDEIKDWHLIPSNFVVDYTYPTAEDISTLWCATEASFQTYSSFSLRLVNDSPNTTSNATSGNPNHAVHYSFSTWGIRGYGTTSPFSKTGIEIVPIGPTWADLENFGCPSLQCPPGEVECMQQTPSDDNDRYYRCSALVNVRLYLCTVPRGVELGGSSVVGTTSLSLNPLPTFQTTDIPPPKKH